MNMIGSTRGHFMVCDLCVDYLKKEGFIDEKGRAKDDISGEFCPDCIDRNKVLIDDLAGSSE